MRRSALLICLCLLPATWAHGATGFGPRLGLSNDSDDIYVGGQIEFANVLSPYVGLVPSLDFGPGSDAQSVANADFRVELFPLPETGIRFYAGAGPTMMLSGDLELGLSLTLGLKIPMQAGRRYNVEYRWGLGDIPDHKVGFAVMFGL